MIKIVKSLTILLVLATVLSASPLNTRRVLQNLQQAKVEVYSNKETIIPFNIDNEGEKIVTDVKLVPETADSKVQTSVEYVKDGVFTGLDKKVTEIQHLSKGLFLGKSEGKWVVIETEMIHGNENQHGLSAHHKFDLKFGENLDKVLSDKFVLLSSTPVFRADKVQVALYFDGRAADAEMNPPAPAPQPETQPTNLKQPMVQKNYGVVLVLKLDQSTDEEGKHFVIESYFAKNEYDHVALGSSADDKYPFCGFKNIAAKDPEPVFTGVFCGQFYTEGAGEFKHLVEITLEDGSKPTIAPSKMFFTNRDKSYVYIAIESATHSSVDIHQFEAKPKDSSAWKAVGAKKTFNTPETKENKIIVTSNLVAVLSTLNAEESKPVLRALKLGDAQATPLEIQIGAVLKNSDLLQIASNPQSVGIELLTETSDKKKRSIVLVNHQKVHTLISVPTSTTSIVPGMVCHHGWLATLLVHGEEADPTKVFSFKLVSGDHPVVKVWTTSELEEEYKYTQEVSYFGEAEATKTAKSLQFKKFDRSISWKPTEKITKEKLVEDKEANLEDLTTISGFATEVVVSGESKGLSIEERVQPSTDILIFKNDESNAQRKNDPFLSFDTFKHGDIIFTAYITESFKSESGEKMRNFRLTRNDSTEEFSSNDSENVFNFDFVTVPTYTDGFFVALSISKKSKGTYIKFVKIPFAKSTSQKDIEETKALKESLETVIMEDMKVSASAVGDVLTFKYSGISKHPQLESVVGEFVTKLSEIHSNADSSKSFTTITSIDRSSSVVLSELTLAPANFQIRISYKLTTPDVLVYELIKDGKVVGDALKGTQQKFNMEESQLECKNEVNALEVNCFIATTGADSYFMSFKVASPEQAVLDFADSEKPKPSVATDFKFQKAVNSDMTVRVLSARVEGNYGLGVFQRVDKRTADAQNTFLIDQNHFVVIYRKSAEGSSDSKFPHGIIGATLAEHHHGDMFPRKIRANFITQGTQVYLISNTGPNNSHAIHKLNDFFKIKITDATKWEEDMIQVKGLYSNGEAKKASAVLFESGKQNSEVTEDEDKSDTESKTTPKKSKTNWTMILIVLFVIIILVALIGAGVFGYFKMQESQYSSKGLDETLSNADYEVGF